MSYVLALDQGTTSSRAIVFDREATIVAVAHQEFRQIFPDSGWVEHDPFEIWESQTAVIEAALRQHQLTATDIAAVGISNQRETTVVWDRQTGRPIYNAIVWQDRRTAAVCAELEAAGYAETIKNKTGLVIDPYFAGTKIGWILDHVPGARERAVAGELAFGTIDSWLTYQLTDRTAHATDISNAARTLLYNIHTEQWDDELLSIFAVPRELLPEVRSCSEVVGEISQPAVLKGCLLAGSVGDQQAATMGQMCIEPGLAKNTYGTGCFLLMNTGTVPRPSANRLLTTIAWKRARETTFALEGSVFVGGAIVQWLRDGLGLIKASEEVETLAASVPDSGDVVMVPALVGLGAPYWDASARGTIFGLSRGTTAGHLARAALEGIALSVADLVEAMESDAGQPLGELRVDGGAAANNLLLQFQADVLQAPVVRPTTLETTALGAAYMAGLATGYWKSLDEIRGHWKIDRVFEPQASRQQMEAVKDRWKSAVQRSLNWVKPSTC